MRAITAIAVALLSFQCASETTSRMSENGGMTQQALTEVIGSIDAGASGPPGAIEFSHDGIRMACISDTTHGRMRIIAPVRAVSELSAAQVAAILEANFHSTLDARYATSQGVLYAAFIHPLAPLTPRQIASAARQVASLVRSFGSTYSSGELVYNESGQLL
jgi:hypothetical protein